MSVLTGVPDARDFLATDKLLDTEEILIRDTVRRFVAERITPDVGEWFEHATFPRELIKEIAALGLLGMHLDGYGCAGTIRSSCTRCSTWRPSRPGSDGLFERAVRTRPAMSSGVVMCSAAAGIRRHTGTGHCCRGVLGARPPRRAHPGGVPGADA